MVQGCQNHQFFYEGRCIISSPDITCKDGVKRVVQDPFTGTSAKQDSCTQCTGSLYRSTGSLHRPTGALTGTPDPQDPPSQVHRIPSQIHRIPLHRSTCRIPPQVHRIYSQVHGIFTEVHSFYSMYSVHCSGSQDPVLVFYRHNQIPPCLDPIPISLWKRDFD